MGEGGSCLRVVFFGRGCSFGYLFFFFLLLLFAWFRRIVRWGDSFSFLVYMDDE